MTETKFEEIEFKANAVHVKFDRLKATGDKHKNEFAITDALKREILSKYYLATPEDQRVGRFFRQVTNGVPGKQPMGINTIGNVGKDVAKYLGYSDKDVEQFTGHCFRRTGATILAECGASVSTLKIAGNWKSSTVAEGYINNSNRMKRNIASAFNVTDGIVDVVQNSREEHADNKVDNGYVGIAPDVTHVIYNGPVYNLSGPVSGCQFHLVAQTVRSESAPVGAPAQSPVETKEAAPSPVEKKRAVAAESKGAIEFPRRGRRNGNM